MELAQVAQPAAFTLLGTGLLLGLRHGVDWDHIAAILDITGTSGQDAIASSPRSGLARLQSRAFWMALLYALGHALVVVVLGVAAIAFTAVLPAWVDPIMERVVGFTLVALAAYVAYSLVRYMRGEEEFQLRSRWMLVFAGARRLTAMLRGTEHTHKPVGQYGWRSAVGVGMIHGIGAETGSQALLIAAIGGAADNGLGMGMLMAFVVGLVVSNSVIAVLASTGFVSSRYARPAYVAIGVMTAVFSLVIGLYFIMGIGDQLADLYELTAFLGVDPR